MLFRILHMLRFLFKAESRSNLRNEISELERIIHMDACKVPENQEILNRIELLRKKLCTDRRIIPNINPGAGKNRNSTIRISDIAKKATSSSRDRMLFFSIIKNLQPAMVVELGTSLGFGSIAMALANSETRIISVEGNPYLVELAQKNMKSQGVENIQIISAEFDSVLPDILGKIKTPFVVFVDGNHSYEATIRYFNAFSKSATDGCLIIFHDINWSAGMQQAWKDICNTPLNISCMEDYKMGLVYFAQKRQQKLITLRRF